MGDSTCLGERGEELLIEVGDSMDTRSLSSSTLQSSLDKLSSAADGVPSLLCISIDVVVGGGSSTGIETSSRGLLF